MFYYITLLASLLCLSIVPFKALASVKPKPNTPATTKQHIALNYLLSKARQEDGVPLLVNSAIADEKILTNIVDAAELKKALDLLPGYQWLLGQYPDGKAFYVLSPDWGERYLWKTVEAASSKKEQDDLAQRNKERLEEYFDALSLPRDKLKEYEQDDPWLVWSLSNSNTLALLVYLQQLSPVQFEQIFHPAGLSIKFSDLPFDLQVELVCWLHAEAQTGYWHPPCKLDDLERILLEGATLGFGSGSEGIEFGIGFPHVPPNALGAGGVGETLIRPSGLYVESGRMQLRIERGMPRDEARKLLQDERKKSREQAAAEEDTGKQTWLRLAHPYFGGTSTPSVALTESLKCDQTFSSISEVCAAAGIPCAVRYFDRYDRKLKKPITFEKGTKIAAMLDYLADDMGFVWGHADGVIVATSRHLWTDAAREIPDELLTKWRGIAKTRNGALTLDDLARMSTELTIGQLSGLPSDLIRAGGMTATLKREQLRFYASLDREQKATAWSKVGLAYSALSPTQAKLFVKSASERSDGLTTLKKTPAVFRVGTKNDLITFNYGFTDASEQAHLICPVKYATSPDVAVNQPKIEQPVVPSEVQVAMALANYSYTGNGFIDGKDPFAIVQTIADDGISGLKSTTLKVGDKLAGAQLAKVSPTALVFFSEKLQINMPRSKSISIPYQQQVVK